ncbi:MAG: 16S rRNA (uracil(1498)-N(3))-methyltransferase [Spirochaetales bacterium]|nr:16S rRNA (uracil(1498)-N(3))-methyltransferase [Spirochaetales bacterium]
MNLILFEENELTEKLHRDDPRAIHILSVLRRTQGETFDAGVIDGKRGKGIVRSISTDSLVLDFVFADDSSTDSLYPVTLVVGLPRPQTVRKILREATTLGVSSIYFTATERGEESYGKSTLWTSGEVRKHLISGAQQAFHTLLPEVKLFDTLSGCIDALLPGGCVALDNYEATISLKDFQYSDNRINILVGPEKGWSADERNFLRKKGFTLAKLGERVLRTETAAIAGITLVLAGLGLI